MHVGPHLEGGVGPPGHAVLGVGLPQAEGVEGLGADAVPGAGEAPARGAGEADVVDVAHRGRALGEDANGGRVEHLVQVDEVGREGADGLLDSPEDVPRSAVQESHGARRPEGGADPQEALIGGFVVEKPHLMAHRLDPG